MAAPRLTVNPYINDFLYHIIYSANLEDRRRVPSRYLKKIKTSVSAKKFVDKSYMEEKLELFSALGIGYFLVLFDRTGNRARTIGQMFEKFKTDTYKSDMNQIIEQNMYVLSDTKFAFYQGLMADATNSPAYFQNLLFNKSGYHIQKWKKEMKGLRTNTAKNHIEISGGMAQLVDSLTVQLKYVDSILSITYNDFQILNYLYIKQNKYVDYSEMVKKYSGDLNLNKITGCLRRLTQNKMVQKTPKANEKKFQITAIGINAIATFYKQVLKANEF